MKTVALFAGIALFSAAAEAHLSGQNHHYVHRRHAPGVAARAVQPVARRSEIAKRRLSATETSNALRRRKTPLGEGDSTTLPGNVAEGSDSSDCTVSSPG